MDKKGFTNKRQQKQQRTNMKNKKKTQRTGNKVNTIQIDCVYVLRASSEVSFFCLLKLLSWNIILWFGNDVLFDLYDDIFGLP